MMRNLRDGAKEENQTGGGLPGNTTTNLIAAQQQAMYFQHQQMGGAPAEMAQHHHPHGAAHGLGHGHPHPRMYGGMGEAEQHRARPGMYMPQPMQGGGMSGMHAHSNPTSHSAGGGMMPSSAPQTISQPMGGGGQQALLGHGHSSGGHMLPANGLANMGGMAPPPSMQPGLHMGGGGSAMMPGAMSNPSMGGAGGAGGGMPSALNSAMNSGMGAGMGGAGMGGAGMPSGIGSGMGSGMMHSSFSMVGGVGAGSGGGAPGMSGAPAHEPEAPAGGAAASRESVFGQSKIAQSSQRLQQMSHQLTNAQNLLQQMSMNQTPPPIENSQLMSQAIQNPGLVAQVLQQQQNMMLQSLDPNTLDLLKKLMMGTAGPALAGLLGGVPNPSSQINPNQLFGLIQQQQQLSSQLLHNTPAPAPAATHTPPPNPAHSHANANANAHAHAPATSSNLPSHAGVGHSAAHSGLPSAPSHTPAPAPAPAVHHHYQHNPHPHSAGLPSASHSHSHAQAQAQAHLQH